MKMLDEFFNTTVLTQQQQIDAAVQSADDNRRAGLLVDAHHDEWVASALRDMLGLPQAEAYERGSYKLRDLEDRWDS